MSDGIRVGDRVSFPSLPVGRFGKMGVVSHIEFEMVQVKADNGVTFWTSVHRLVPIRRKPLQRKDLHTETLL